MSQTILPETLLSTLADIERRIINLERSPRLTNSSIKDGALVVLDSAGVVRAKIGKDGSDYGVKIFDAAGANAVSLAALSFGQTWDQVDLPEESTTSTTYVDLATVGPTVPATIGPSGKAIVMAGAYMTSTVPNQTVRLGLQVDGFAPIDMGAMGNSSSGGISADGLSSTLQTGLSPGPHTFRLKYAQTLGGATARFAFRWILVLPF